ncbi:MAG: hypothetical protein DMG09_18645 [Acidobacteria bacterium]|nr:MAG: hypothetical protein DMG09_18645 [Acidobacteriota bacterium]
MAVCLGASGLDVEEKETIQKTFNLAAAARELRIDNIDGAIHVAGQAGSDIEFVIEKTLRAESREKIDFARQEVKLDLSQKENVVQAYVDAPWRCRDGGINYRGWRFHGYRVRFDFEVKVPPSTRLFLRTVNDGEIRVENTAGEFDIENVNGGIEMTEIAGSGRAYALNGKVRAVFSQNPKAESFFGSLNGKVEALFREGLSADLLFKRDLSSQPSSDKRAAGREICVQERRFLRSARRQRGSGAEVRCVQRKHSRAQGTKMTVRGAWEQRGRGAGGHVSNFFK